MAMILRRLQAVGFTDTQANAHYGIYTTMAIPIFNLIPALLTSVSLSLIPALSSHIAKHDVAAQQQDVDASLILTALLSLPASFALSVYSQPILKLLFHASVDELSLAAPLLSVLGASVAFSGLITTTNSILQSYSHTKVPIVSMLIGCVIKLCTAYVLIAAPGVHILGAPISSLICNVLIVGINLFAIQRIGSIQIRTPRTLFAPMFVSLFSVGLPALFAALLHTRGVSDVICFLVAIPVTLLIHLLLIIKLDLLDLSLINTSSNLKIHRFLMRIPVIKRLCAQRIKN
jgi:stage V sporulation protein B